MRLSPPVVSVYLMADADTAELAEAAVGAGAGLLEIGIPYSDPLADGPTVQRAGQRSLAAGMTTRRALDVLREVRARVAVPLVPMTYAAPVMVYGERRFCADAAAAGADGLIVPDVPADEAGELVAGCREHGLDLVPLLAPTSADERIALACAHAGGFIYLVRWPGSPAPAPTCRTASPAWRSACGRTPTCRCWWASASRRPSTRWPRSRPAPTG